MCQITRLPDGLPGADSATLHEADINLKVLGKKNLELLVDVFLSGHASATVRSQAGPLLSG